MSFLLDLLFPPLDLSFFSTCSTQAIRHPTSSNFDGIITVFKYQSQVKNTIHDLKFNFVSEAIPCLSAIISQRLFSDFPNIIKYWRENNFVLVPIPLHSRRQNWRGFNQSELLCQSLSPLLKLDTQNLLVRTKKTLAQSSLPKSSRQKNISSAFEINFLSPFLQRGIKGDLNLILIDDVYTTGSTLNSAASVFPKNSTLWALTIAG